VLTLFDCVCIIVGTIIGAGIFQFPGVVASHLPNFPWFLGVWVFGGFIALVGALCFAELTTTYPDSGGDYGYLKRAYHPQIGFAFSWTAFWVIRPGNIGALAMIFGKFGVSFFEQLFQSTGYVTPFWLAILVVIAITALNGLGVVFSKTAQNCLTSTKVIGILILLGAAFAMATAGQPGSQSDASAKAATNGAETASPPVENVPPERLQPQPLKSPVVAEAIVDKRSNWSSFWLAMVFVMFTFGGWNDIAFMASEVVDPQKNLLKSLLLGTLAVLGIYLIVNLCLVSGLGMEVLADLGSRFENPTSLFVERATGAGGAALFSALVSVSCLGGINAMIFTSPRIYWATARDYPSLTALTGSSADRKGWRSMALQCGVTILFIVTFGRKDEGIDNLVAATAPYFWLFLALTVLGLIINRYRYAGQFVGFRVPLYPLTPLIFISACGFMMYQAWSYLISKELGFAALLIGLWVVLGMVLSLALKRVIPEREG
jgi:amino acid transporter